MEPSKITRSFTWPLQAPIGDAVNYHDKYVIHYDFTDIGQDEAIAELQALCHDLRAVGLEIEVRAGQDKSLLIFVRCPKKLLDNAVFKSRVKDWLWGITPTEPSAAGKGSLVDDAFEAESLLSVYHLVHWSKELGGAGITPGEGKWKHVRSIFPIHNTRANNLLLLHLSKRVFLSNEDLDMIRNLFGAKVAFYYAYMQIYFLFLFFPAVTGALAWAFLPKYSLLYAVLNLFGCTVFLEYWKIQQTDLSIRWNVSGVGALKVDRAHFRYEKTIIDTAGRIKHYYPQWKSILRRMSQVPFFLAALLILGTVIALVFAIEVLISEAYQGPYKSWLEYLPTILLAISLPYMNSYLEDTAEWLADFENHRTHDNFDMSLTLKRFALSFIANYLPILLTAFVYIPMGAAIVPYLEAVLRWALGSTIATKYLTVGSLRPDADRLRDEMIALTMTGHLSDMFEESIQPYLLLRLRTWYRTYRTSHARDRSLTWLTPDDPAEHHFLQRVRAQSAMPVYNVQDDIAEMAIQFGYLALFGTVWPLVAVGFLVNNWVELRSDFLKLCAQQRRPHPGRTDGIGAAWVGALDGLAWMGSISAAAIVHMYGRSGAGAGGDGGVFDYTGSSWLALVVTVFAGEHLFLLMRSTVASALRRLVGSEQVRREQDARYAFRKKYLDGLEDAHARDTHANQEKQQQQQQQQPGIAHTGTMPVGAGDGAEQHPQQPQLHNLRDSRPGGNWLDSGFWSKQADAGMCERAGAALIKKVSFNAAVARKSRKSS